MDAIRWGIIGCGDVTEKKSGPGFQKASRSELVAVMRRNGALARDYAERHGVPKWYDDAAELLRDPDVTAVYVATPPSSHRKYVLAAAAAGKPVYVEKPMALNYAECREMIEGCENAGIPLFVAYYRRALPRFLKIRELLDHGAIGVPSAVTVQFAQPVTEQDRERIPHWRVDPAIAGGGYFVDLASHTLDLLQFYFGPVTAVSGTRENRGGFYAAEDFVAARFGFENGVGGSGVWNFVAEETVDSVEITGSAGSIAFSTFGHDPVVLRRSGLVEQFDIPHPPHIEQPLIQTIVDELTGRGTCPSTGRSGSLTSLVMDRILGRIV